MSVQKVRFTITGSFLTNMSRGLVLENRWDESINC